MRDPQKNNRLFPTPFFHDLLWYRRTLRISTNDLSIISEQQHLMRVERDKMIETVIVHGTVIAVIVRDHPRKGLHVHT